MASSKLLMTSIAAAFVIYGVGADSGIEELRSRLSALEYSIADRIQDIKKKDQSILNFENAINEKSASIFSLQSQIELLRKQAAADAQQYVEKVNKQASEMEKQVARLKSEIEAQTMKRGALEARGAEAEKNMQELNLKLERFFFQLQENYDKQKLRIKNTERDLQVAEEELMKAQLEAASKLKKLTEKWIPVAKERMFSFTSYVQPYAQLTSAKTMEVYETFKKKIAPHIMKVQELPNPYFLEARRFSKPYVDQITNVARPHVEQLQVVFDPNLAVQSYKKFAKTTLTYHNQVKVTVHENLKKHDLTKRFATTELSWFLASAILGFPMFFLLRLLSAIFCKKTICGQNANRNQAPRNQKRKHGGK
ncbi:apolipoprotein A-I isoform X12 [Dendrobium catenatum]|uniref:apolipoprotein A-I isoform X12 n=1 Tax=Dendrobium catenatum TaxID=906689 RepID=UPI0010A0233F|nr:apolipoprotein A-I isoform X12 [Dendrobium catenatum]